MKQSFHEGIPPGYSGLNIFPNQTSAFIYLFFVLNSSGQIGNIFLGGGGPETAVLV